jgi:spore coat protein U-like protein
MQGFNMSILRAVCHIEDKGFALAGAASWTGGDILPCHRSAGHRLMAALRGASTHIAARCCISIVAAILMLAAPTVGLAATVTTTFNVQITITNACTIVSATNLNFGSVGVIGAAGVSSTSTITVLCTSLAPYTVGLSAGAGSGATVANRLMTSAATNTVGYSLYQDAAHSVVWGTTTGTDTVAGTGSGASQALTVYGHVPSQSTPPAAVYNDTVTVTVTY